jgi:two-component system, cell cycle response regulator DivK
MLPFRPSSILLVDGNADTRALYREMFARVGCEVIEASDGREALAKAFTRAPTVVVTEMTLPFVDGYALCEILRRDRSTADVPIIAVTADAIPSHINRARQAGADIVLVKPTAVETLLAEMQRLIQDFKGGRRSAPIANLDVPGDASADRVAPANRQRRKTRTKSFARVTTTTPSASPPPLLCPSCYRPLTYKQSHIGGVTEDFREQWDDFECDSCGAFTYRHRTRKISHAS